MISKNNQIIKEWYSTNLYSMNRFNFDAPNNNFSF